MISSRNTQKTSHASAGDNFFQSTHDVAWLEHFPKLEPAGSALERIYAEQRDKLLELQSQPFSDRVAIRDLVDELSHLKDAIEADRALPEPGSMKGLSLQPGKDHHV